MTEKFTRNGIQNFRPFKELMQTIDSGLEERPSANIDPDDIDLLTDDEVFETLPPVVQEAVAELQERLDADMENRSDTSLDMNALAQAKSAITRAGGTFQKVVDEDDETVAIQVRTPGGYKIRN